MRPAALRTLASFLAAVALLAAAQTSAVASIDGVFGAKERPIRGVSLLSKWVRVLDQTLKADEGLGNCGEDASAARCHLSDWAEVRSKAAGIIDRHAQMLFVNRELNKQPYILDITNWGVTDYWEIPEEFKRVSGDCEDYSIAKYLMLRDLGWPEEAMRVAVVHDQNLDIGHAVLLVQSDEESWVLDNQTRSPLPMQRVLHYVPYYSFNSEMTWLHRY